MVKLEELEKDSKIAAEYWTGKIELPQGCVEVGTIQLNSIVARFQPTRCAAMEKGFDFPTSCLFFSQ